MMTISPARTSACDILLAVEGSTNHSSELLAASALRLDAKDRALCHEIVMGSLRRRYFLDHLIEGFSRKKLASLDSEVLTILRMAVYQLRFLSRVPPHAIVNDAVALTIRAGKRSARGFVNAVLRNYLRKPPEPEFDGLLEELSIGGSHPKWMVERWLQRFGEEGTRNIVNSNNSTPGITFRFTVRFDLLATDQKQEIIDSISEVATESEDLEGCWRAGSSSDELLKLSDDGLIYFQDQGSQQVGSALGTKAGDAVLDVCAAPGSKTTQIARVAETVTACDVSLRRLKTLAAGLAVQGADSVEMVALDAGSQLPFAAGAFDRVIVDAPCTGTGTLARNPEIRYRVRPEGPAANQEKQLAILMNASKAVKPGGFLLYSTCSLESEENEEVVGLFLSQTHRFVPEFPGIKGSVPEGPGGELLLPNLSGNSGFFAAGFRFLG